MGLCRPGPGPTRPRHCSSEPSKKGCLSSPPPIPSSGSSAVERDGGRRSIEAVAIVNEACAEWNAQQRKEISMKVVLAYSGGLDTSVIMRWLIETYDAEVIAFCADIGPAGRTRRPGREGPRHRRVQVYIDDLRAEFARDFVFPMIRAGRGVRIRLPARHLHRPAPHRQAHGRNRPGERRRGHQPRRHRQRQRPGPVRGDRLRPAARHQDHRPLAGVGVQVADRPDRLRRSSGTSRCRSRRRSPTAWTATSCTSASRAACWRIRGTNRPRHVQADAWPRKTAPDTAGGRRRSTSRRAMRWRSTARRWIRWGSC